jgi:argininosuccinate lyase
MKEALGIVLSIALFAPAAPAQQPTRDSFYWLNEMNKAAAVMLVERRIVPAALGKTIADAVAQVNEDVQRPGAPRSGDYLQVEQLLVKAGGPDVTRIHSGRSRQDILATSRRLFQRDQLLDSFARMNAARDFLLGFAERHANAVMPAYTWGVQAQPTTFGHYVLAFTETFERDAERLRQAYARLNMSPLGAAALGTSSFPIDRPRLAALLGFDGVVENSYGANQVSPVDTGMELVGIAASSALTVGTIVADITAQYHQSQPWLVLPDDATGGSSIMPQKRNPTSLVALRAQASRLVADAVEFMFLAHNVEPGMGDYKGSEPESVLRDMGRMLDAARATIGQFRFSEERALAEVAAEYSTTTELADTLQRVADVPFRVGHHFASELVNFGRSRRLPPAQIQFSDARRIYTESAKSLGLVRIELPLTEQQFRASLSPQNMVNASLGLGGPQPSEVARMISRQRTQLQSDRRWLDERRSRLDQAAMQLEQAFQALRKR